MEIELLHTFQALLTSTSVTEAARHLGRTQSATSKQLARLREAFSDPLFTFESQRMLPTPRAQALAPQVNDLVARWESMLSERPFDPAQLHRRFVISTTDEVQDWLAPALSRSLLQAAPNSTLAVHPLRPDYSASELESGDTHIVISVNWSAPRHLRQRRLYSDRFVCVMGAHHPYATGRLTFKRYLSAEHLLVAPLGKSRGVVDDILARDGKRRNVRLTVPQFLVAGAILEGTDLIALMPRRAAQRIGEKWSVVNKPPPLDVPDIDYFVFWHPRHDREPGHRFLRESTFAC